MNIEKIKVADLKPYGKNAKTHPEEQVELIANSIKEFGFKTPVVVDKDNVLVQGHGRRLASIKLGLEEIPAIRIHDMDKKKIDMLRLADNKVAESEWDMELLNEELGELYEDFNLDDFGFEYQPTPEEEQKEKEDDVPEPEEKPVIELGDFIELGSHRLLCGDSTSKNDLEKLMQGDKAQLVWTDPPYNVAIEGVAGTIKNDDMSDVAFYEFLYTVYERYEENMEDGACIYVAHADSERVNFTKAFKDIGGFHFAQNLIWNKSHATLSRQDYNWKHEPIIYGWKKGASHYYSRDFTKTTVYSDEAPDYEKMKKEELIKCIKEITGEFRTSVIDFERPSRSELHPTMKPVGLVEEFIYNSSKGGWIVLDLFGGSGSTLIACENSGRKSYSMELDEKYAQVIVQRWCDYTGVDTIRINRKEVSWSEYKSSGGNPDGNSSSNDYSDSFMSESVL